MNKIYVNYDAFNTLNTSSPGFLINLHPTLTRKDNLQTSLAEDMAKVPINRQNSVIKHWLDDNNETTTEAALPIPKFTLFTATRRFGYGENKVEAAVIVIETADKDAQYLKTILNFGYENKYLVHGIFVPTGIHLTTNPAVYKGLLRQQNNFVNSLLVLAIEGLSEEATMQEIEIDGKVTNIGEYIMAHTGMVGLERTGRTSEIGKWFLLYTANAKDTVDTIIDDKLPIIFKSQIDNAHNIEGYLAPRRTNARLTTTTSYADTLKNMIITTENNSKDSKQDAIPINVKKRRPVALSMEEYPILKTTKKQNTTMNTNTAHTPSTVSASISTVTNDHIQSLENKIEAMATQGKTLQEEFDNLKQSIQQQIVETVEVQFNTSIKTKLDTLATDMMTFFQTQMITKMEEMMQHLYTTMTNTAIPPMQHTMNPTQAQTMPLRQFQNNMNQTQIATPLKPQNIQKPPGPITPMTQTQQYGRRTNLSFHRQTATQEEFITQQDSVEHDMDLDADGNNK
jgi:molecular chaperone GrpE (heat shock protein)